MSSTAVAAQRPAPGSGCRRCQPPGRGPLWACASSFTDIEDSPYNETRFAVIGQQECAAPATTRRPSCSSAAHPGSLVDALNVFKQNKLNLTWIESFPAKDRQARIRLLRRFRGPPGRPQGQRRPSRRSKNMRGALDPGSFPMASKSANRSVAVATVLVRSQKPSTDYELRTGTLHDHRSPAEFHPASRSITSSSASRSSASSRTSAGASSAPSSASSATRTSCRPSRWPPFPASSRCCRS